MRQLLGIRRYQSNFRCLWSLQTRYITYSCFWCVKETFNIITMRISRRQKKRLINYYPHCECVVLSCHQLQIPKKARAHGSIVESIISFNSLSYDDFIHFHSMRRLLSPFHDNFFPILFVTTFNFFAENDEITKINTVRRFLFFFLSSLDFVGNVWTVIVFLFLLLHYQCIRIPHAN